MQDRCFTILCWFLSFVNMISRPCACVPSLLNLPPTSPHPTALGYHRAPDLSSLHRTVDFRGLSGFTCDDVYVSMLLSQFSHPLPPSSAPPTSLLSMSASPLLPCKHVHHNHLPRFHVLLLFSHSVVSDSLRPHGLRHTTLPHPSPSPGAYPNSCSPSQ